MTDDFEMIAEFDAPPAQLMVDVDGYEGPLDVLLTLAREQKVDLMHVSIVGLADQYLQWIAKSRQANLELAADYLVMAAWLAFLKSRLLLPAPPGEPELSGEEMAAALQFRLRRLEAMREAAGLLFARPRLGTGVYARGMAEEMGGAVRPIYSIGLYDLLKAYAGHHRSKHAKDPLRIDAVNLYSVEDALKRLRVMLGQDIPNWQSLIAFLPKDIGDPLLRRSALAATFVAGLELSKEGYVALRQDRLFGEISIRRLGKETAPDA